MSRKELNRAIDKARHTYHWFRPDDNRPYLALVPGKSNTYVTLRKLRYEIDSWGLDIPRNLEVDLASVPRLLWWLPGLSPTDSSARMALVHDVCYRGQRLPRRVIDELFRSGLYVDLPKSSSKWLIVRVLANTYRVVLIEAMYYGVRLGGGVAWRKHRAAKQKATDYGEPD